MLKCDETQSKKYGGILKSATLEDFDAIHITSFDSKNDCLKEIAKHYDVDLAVKRNASFK